MIRLVLASAIGMAVGVGVMLVVAASVDSRTAREDKLAREIGDLREEAQRAAADREREIGAVRVQLAEAKSELDAHRSREIGCTVADVVDAIKTEYAVTGSGDAYQVAGGRVVLTFVQDKQGKLIAINLLAGRDQLIEFGRTLVLILQRLRPFDDGQRKPLAMWLTTSIVFTEKQPDAWVRRNFGGLSVGISSMPIEDATPAIIANFHAED